MRPGLVEEQEGGCEIPEELKRVLEVRGPTKAMKDKHHLENHVVYAECCPVCVSAKGIGAQHAMIGGGAIATWVR